MIRAHCQTYTHTSSVCGQVAAPDTKPGDKNKKEKKQDKGQAGGGGGVKEVMIKDTTRNVSVYRKPQNKKSSLYLPFTKLKRREVLIV